MGNLNDSDIELIINLIDEAIATCNNFLAQQRLNELRNKLESADPSDSKGEKETK